jgi:hypothetical protein
MSGFIQFEIANEELEHAHWFLALKDEIEKSPDRPQVKEMDLALVENLIGKQAFSLADVNFSMVKNSEALIDIFIEKAMRHGYVQNTGNPKRLEIIS